MIIEAAKNGHTQVVQLHAFDYPSSILVTPDQAFCTGHELTLLGDGSPIVSEDSIVPSPAGSYGGSPTQCRLSGDDHYGSYHCTGKAGTAGSSCRCLNQPSFAQCLAASHHSPLPTPLTGSSNLSSGAGGNQHSISALAFEM
ncbi:hypothetical protein OUZ56_023503 [Daphnia magna]|uniref:Uncharacterized protein n=1 Tax=Daphnia magna TaxID=35525 RepID=A0ABR0AZ99_9CRUS|nr:hypothetical protein OUZ56_023503 [Daphnia magna]